MLRGLDTWGKSDADPIIIKAADREPLSGSVTVYVNESVSAESHDRFRTVLDSLDRLEAAEVVDEPRITTWPDRVEAPAEGPEASAVACYDEFVEAAGADALGPEFDEQETDDGRIVELADICIAIREDSDLTGLYAGDAIEDCLTGLAAGESVQNLA